MHMNRLTRLGVSVLICYGAGLLGTLFVSTGVGSWYDTLAKPFFMPPDWLFAPVWIVLYGCMALALTLVWQRDESAGGGGGWVPLFITHLLLNAAWTIFFFGFHAIFIALIDIALLTACIILLMVGAWQIDRRATYFLAPYLLWTLFATVLNGSIWLMN